MEEYGAYIKECRKEMGYTQAELSERSGVALATIKRYEKGQVEPKMSSLEMLAKALGFRTWHELLYNRRTGSLYGISDDSIAWYGEVKPDMDASDMADFLAFKKAKIKALQERDASAKPFKISNVELERIKKMRELNADQLSLIDKMLGL